MPEAVRMMHGGIEPEWASKFPDTFLRSAAGNGVHVPTLVAILLWAMTRVLKPPTGPP